MWDYFNAQLAHLDTPFSQLVAVLLLWSLLSMGVAVLGLYAHIGGEFVRAFWFMNGLWGFVDGVIVLWCLTQKPPENSQLATVLLINAGFDVAYLLVGVVLLSFKQPRLRGFGWAVVLQGTFLLVLDGVFWRAASG